VLLRHFGEEPPRTCGNCDNCLDAPEVIDTTQLAQKLLSAAYRTGQSFGFGHLQKVLTGADDERVRARGHDRLSVFGIVESEEARLLQPVSRALQARGSLVANEHGGLHLAGDAKAILKGEAALTIVRPPLACGGRRSRDAAPNPVGDPLFEALRALRRDLAAEAGVPPYVVFHDAVLRAMAAQRPASRADLATIPGVGERKLAAYGEAFLKAIRDN
jgi:ATP-dependent DNA helicase RecQ